MRERRRQIVNLDVAQTIVQICQPWWLRRTPRQTPGVSWLRHSKDYVGLAIVTSVPYEEGLSDWRVYSAEQSVGRDSPLGPGEGQHLVDQAVASDWFREWFPHTEPIVVQLGGRDDPEFGFVSSYATPLGYPRPTNWLISMHPRMLTARVLLHELAHCVQPVFEVAGGMRSGDGWQRRKHRVHDEFFTAALGVITDYMRPDDGGQLLAACRHYDAPIATREALCEQLDGQPAILDDEERGYEEIRRDTAEMEARYENEHGKPLESRIPEMPWVFHFEMMRRDRRRRVNGRLVSQRQVAEAVTKVTPCSARHISAIENSRRRPDDPALLKRAMLAAIF